MLKLFRGWSRTRTPAPEPSPPSPLESHSLLFGADSAKQVAAAEIRTVVVIGNCIAEGIAEGLCTSKATSMFRFVVLPIHTTSLHDTASLKLMAEASHVFVQQFDDIDLSAVNALVAPDCAVFSFPSLAMHDLWPFDSANGYRDDIAQTVAQDRIRHFDGALASLREIEPDKKKRIARYSELDFPLASKIDSVAKAQTRFLQQIDERSDCKIGRFIERNRRERQLFYSSHHPTQLVFQELCAYCLGKLGCQSAVPVRLEADGWKDWSVPVHPLIARRLGIVWAQEATRYRYCTLGDITWREWVEAYVEAFG